MNKKENYQIVARKYRPQTFQDVVGQETIVTTLKNGLKAKRIPHAYLFCGTRGTGKTTLARLMAKALNCRALSETQEPCNICTSCREITAGNSLNVLEIDGASHRGIDDIRQINETISFAPKGDTYKIYIIDEVHMLTREAFNALLKTLEEPPPSVLFFFATTEPHKILPTIISRTQRFDLKRIPLASITQKLARIATDMNVKIEEEALALIARVAEGGLRDAESLFDQTICGCPSPITIDAVRNILGMPSHQMLFDLDRATAAADLSFAVSFADAIFAEGKDLTHLLDTLHTHFHTLLLIKIAPEHTLKERTPQERAALTEAAALYHKEQLFFLVDLITEQIQNLTKGSFKRIHLEMLLLKIIRSKTVTTLGALAQKLTSLQSGAPSSLPARPDPTPATPLAAELAPPAPAPVAEEKPSQPAVTEVKKGSGIKKKCHYDTLVRFTAVELEGSVKP